MEHIIAEMLIAWIIGLVIALYIHEIGHLCIGILNGWKFFTLSVGPLKLYRENIDEKIKIGFENNISCWFGVGATVPKEANEDNLKIWSKILIGGPLFSVFSGIIFIVLSIFYKKLFLFVFGLDSVAIGTINIIPSSLRTGFFYNDGKRYRRIKTGGVEAEEEQEIMHIIEKAVIEGNNAKIYEEECRKLMTSDDYIYRYYAYYILYNSYKNYDDIQAEKYCHLAKEIDDRIPESVKKMFLVGDL